MRFCQFFLGLSFSAMLILLYSCSDSKPVKPESATKKSGSSVGNRTDLKLTVSNDTILIFSGNVEVNEVDYEIQSVYGQRTGDELIQLMNGNDTIRFYKDPLYISDSIYDINNDSKDDFIIKYRTSNGFLIVVYLFDKEKKRLSKIPIDIHNYLRIDSTTYFQINNNFLVYEFRKHDWSGVKRNYKTSYFIDNSAGSKTYFKPSKNDKIKLNFSEIPRKDRIILNQYLDHK